MIVTKFLLGRVRSIIQWVVVAFFGSTILAVVALRFVPVYFTPLMFIRLAQQAGDGKQLKMHHPVAVMASEDQRFMDHHGFDFKAIEYAAKRNKQKDKPRLGASTISQQTAKNVFLWPGRTWVRKGLEAYFTSLIELMWSKQRIMEVYLNSIEMGDGIYGADAVAEYHFDCEAKDLTRAQCALIAATLPNPRKFNSAAPSAYMLKRQTRIMREMRHIPVFPKEGEDKPSKGKGK